ncbi:MAG: ATP-binding protein [Bacillota bacterium]|nr:ATP-binding protein [Bacillota bacterium]
MFKSIQWKILTLFVLLAVSVMIFVGAFSAWGVSKYYHTQFTKDMSQATFTESMVGQLNQAAETSFDQLVKLLGMYSVRIGIDTYRNVYVLDGKTGSCLYSVSGDKLAENYERTPNVLSAMAGKYGNETNENTSIMDYAVPVTVKGNVQYVIYVTDTKVEMYDVMRSILANIFLALLIGIIVAVFLGFVLSKTIISPLASLQDSATHMAEGNFDDVIKVNGEDEIGNLTKAFNNMAAELSSTMKGMTAEKNKIETILLYMTDGVIAFNALGELIHINPAAVKMLGVDREDIKGFDQFFKDLNLDINLGEFLYLNRESFEKTVTVSDRHYRVYLAPLISGGRSGGVVAVFQDFTQQQKLDNARREFVANVSHELRTPLTTIKSYVETLMEGKEHDEMENHFLTVIDSETDRMTRLVKDLLALSRLDNNTGMNMERINLSDLTASICERLSIEFKNHSHTLVAEIAEVPDVLGDKDRLSQVIINVITNAIKYTPDGGEIGVYCNYSHSSVYLKVRDNGLGIPEQDLPRIFERFYRVDKARSRAQGGTGLGLAIAKEIIDAHGGKITIESEEDKGTVVTILLPVLDEDNYNEFGEEI